MFVGFLLIGLASANLFQPIKLPHTAETLNKELETRILELFESADPNEDIFVETCELIIELPELRTYKKLNRYCRKALDGKFQIPINPVEISDRPVLQRRAVALTRCYDANPKLNNYLREEAALLTKYFRSMNADVCPTLMQVADKGSLKRFAKRVLLAEGLDEDWEYYRAHVDEEFKAFCVHMADLRYEKDSRIRDAAHRAVSLIRTERGIWQEAESSTPLDRPGRLGKVPNDQHALTPFAEEPIIPTEAEPKAAESESPVDEFTTPATDSDLPTVPSTTQTEVSESSDNPPTDTDQSVGEAFEELREAFKVDIESEGKVITGDVLSQTG